MSFMSTQSIAVLTATLSLAAACTEPNGGGDPAPVTDVLAVIEQRLGPTPQTFTIDGATGGAIQGTATRFTIPAGAIVDSGGNAVTGPVEISLRELATVGDMLRGGRPTVTSDGQLLLSSGAFDLEATDQLDRPVDVRELRQVVLRRWQGDQAAGMELWVAGRGNAWSRPASGPVRAILQGDNYVFESAPLALGVNAVNCDMLWSIPSTDRMTLKVQVDEALVDGAAVFFMPAGQPSIARFSVRDTSLPGFVSYADSMPVGTAGTLIVLAIVDGHHYLHHDDSFVIPAGVADATGLKVATVQASPVEVPEADFMAYVASL